MLPKNNYVDGDKLHAVMTDYYHKLQEAKSNNSKLPPIPEYVGECIMQITHGVAKRPNFSRYSYRDEMIDDAQASCVYGTSMFNPTKPNANAFNYFTTISWQAMVQRIEKEKKQNYIKHAHFVTTYSSIDGTLLEMNAGDNEVSNRIVREFEERQAIKKEKQAKKKASKTALDLDME